MTTNKVAFITGITGQDGSYLAELLLERGYIVHGMIRRASNFNTDKIDHLIQDKHEKKETKFFFHFGDITNTTCLINILSSIKPNEIYNLAGQSHVGVSFDLAEFTAECNGMGTLKLLEAIRVCKLEKHIKLYQASTSEMFGNTLTDTQNEKSAFNPCSPYAISKLFAHQCIKNYRESYGIFACSGILFNHESPRRGKTFVTRKITIGVAKIKLGRMDCLYLGNLDTKRDWGHAKDYCIDLNTKILTIEGYKKRSNIKIFDCIINYNIKKNIWDIDYIDNIYDIKNYKGFMYKFYGNNFIFRCSPNHIIYYQYNNKKNNENNENKDNWSKTFKKIKAKDLYNIFLNDKTSIYNYRFPGFCNNFKGRNNNNSTTTFISNNMIKFIGYILLNGYFYNNNNDSNQYDIISIDIEEYNKNKFQDIIDNINEFNTLEYKILYNNNNIYSYILSKQSSTIIIEKYFNNSTNINSLPLIFYSLSSKQAKILLLSMINTCNMNKNKNKNIFITTKYNLAKDFIHLANLSGLNALISRIKTYNNVTKYIVTLTSYLESKFNYIFNIKQEFIQEDIWCVKTRKNGTIITNNEDFNTCFISGNCNAMWKMLQLDKPIDLVISTGKTYSVRYFVEESFKCIGYTIKWKGIGIEEVGYINNNPDNIVVRIDPIYYRPSEVYSLCGDSSLAQNLINWKPTYSLKDIIKEMIEHDLKEYSQ